MGRKPAAAKAASAPAEGEEQVTPEFLQKVAEVSGISLEKLLGEIDVLKQNPLYEALGPGFDKAVRTLLDAHLGDAARRNLVDALLPALKAFALKGKGKVARTTVAMG